MRRYGIDLAIKLKSAVTYESRTGFVTTRSIVDNEVFRRLVNTNTTSGVDITHCSVLVESDLATLGTIKAIYDA